MTNPVTETKATPSSPTISRSSTTKTTFTNLTPADTISRSTVEKTTITRTLTPDNRECSSISIKRSKLHSCTLTNASTRRCTLTNTTLLNVPAARSLDASNSSLSNIRRLRRSEIRASAVSDSSLSRSTVVDSTPGEEGSPKKLRGERVCGYGDGV
ncbi:hypothetical protein CNMCM6106_005869 [Aspergillus hiratsukae]|uniref:Uncharacterized protein n=1 Tax=Aspergillus hiratsukae TaxID=1194566 RepID=A0A8H6V129_9EURO|nr:hypothetical protein CNMCM6106_005869 [Aspergillus hiratsukae]